MKYSDYNAATNVIANPGFDEHIKHIEVISFLARDKVADNNLIRSGDKTFIVNELTTDHVSGSMRACVIYVLWLKECQNVIL